MSMFTKLIKAKFNPNSGCFVEDGAILCVLPLHLKKLSAGKSHCFLSARDHKTKSKIGWISTHAPFSIAEFVEFAFGPNLLLREEVIETNRRMLETIKNIEENKPVAVSYMRRGIPPEMHLIVHPVVLYSM